MNLKYKIFVTIFIQLIQCCSGQKYTYDLELDDNCIIEQTGKPGICKLLKNCPTVATSWKYVDDINRPTICGFDNKNVIICCESDNKVNLINNIVSKIDVDDYRPFNETCFDETTKEYGIISKIRDCPYALEQLDKGILLPSICPYSICSDLVCCIRNQCTTDTNCGHQTIENIIFGRLNNNFECQVADTNENGIYTLSNSCSYSDYLKDQNKQVPKACDWKICEGYTCCPKVDLNGTACLNADRDTTQLIAGNCEMDVTGEPGICTFLIQCPSQLFNRQQTLCGTNCYENLICCPEPDTSKLRPNEQACSAYRTTVYDDTKSIDLISIKSDSTRSALVQPSTIGGKFVGQKEFPHMTILGYDVNGEIEWNCGGSLISDQFVLTAGHCLFDKGNNPVKYAKIGLIDLNITDCSCSKSFDVIERIPNPFYKTGLPYHDIGLLKLNRKVQFRSHVRPICLPSKSRVPENLKAIEFGESVIDDVKSNRMIKVNLDLFTDFECNETFKLNFTESFNRINNQIQFCAGSKNLVMNMCHGISGGPIQADHPDYNKMGIIYGVSLFGRSCEVIGQPALYTSVYPYVRWIEKIVWPL